MKYNPTAPVYANGGRVPPQVGENDFVGPELPKELFNGPEVPYGFYDAPINWDNIEARQHYAESRFKKTAKSGKGARGPYQIMPRNWDYYSKKLGLTGSVDDYNNNKAVRDVMMDDLYNRSWATKGFPSDSVRTAKTLAAYNWGSGNLTDHLQNLKNQGVDIYHSMDWISTLPPETENYVNFILREKDGPGDYTTEAFEKALPHRFDAFPEVQHAKGGHLFETGGPADERRQARGYSAYLSAIGQEDSPILQKRYADTYSRIEEASDFVRDYYNSEGYKRRAVASGLTDENPVENPTAFPVPNMNLRDSFNSGTTARIGFIGDSGSTYLTPIPGTGISNTVDDVTVHELGHQNPNYWRLKSNPSGIAAPQQSVEILDSFKRRPANEHDAQTNESYSDLLQLRYQLQNLGIFDSTDPNAVFDRGMLKQYKDATYGGNSRYLYLHGDDNTVKAINEVAQNDMQNRFGNFAASGGKIHIKPENRGKFTALLKRTGKSASWFKAHGTPLQRKRATFALNARKWKHAHGGIIF